jgi:hypothetical protein
MKYDVLIFEPNLDDRKQLTQLFPLKRFIIKFFSDYEELAERINFKVPHFILFNLDHKAEHLDKNFKYLSEIIPEEVFIIGMSKKDNLVIAKKTKKYKLSDIWKKPIAGVSVLARISSYVDNIQPLKFKFASAQKVNCSVNGTINALGEADFLINVPFNAQIGIELDVESELIKSILDEDKSSIVTKSCNAASGTTRKALTLTMLGLKNEDLQKIRSTVLHWDKF